MSEGPTPATGAFRNETRYHSFEPATTVRITITTPTNPRRYVDLEIDPRQARCLAPLPRGREIDPRDHRAAVERSHERARLAQYVAAKFIEMIEQDDTINGYSREDWEAMNRQPEEPK